MKKMWILGILPFLLPSAVPALTINEALVHVINTNPEVRERIENYRAVEQDRGIAFSGYLPVLDVGGSIGEKRYDDVVPAYNTDKYTYSEAFIRARQNLFHGFGTQNDVEQQDKRIISAEYYLMEKVSQLGLEMIDRYLEILKSRKIVDLAHENHEVHKDYYSKIKQRTASGAGTQGDMEQISGRLALSQSNVIIAENNLLDAKINFLRIYGYDTSVSASDLREPKVDKTLIPATLERAEEMVVEKYPSILASQNNVKALEAGYQQTKENYYPWVDLELKQSYYDNDADSFTGSDLRDEVDQTTIMVIATWNLYNGGADDALKQKAAARMFEESDRMLNVKRLSSERLQLSWAAKERLAEIRVYLKKHRDFSKKTLDAYNEEFNLGRRTLLDLLDVKNEYFSSRKAYISTYYDEILAQYRVIENVGNLPNLVSVTSDDVLKFKRYSGQELNK
ncbi:TolC family outer membrane protein [Sulfurovum sp.]|uniref:TolC family outer membrane protein n=1 Tax=Sulfurovum sp. TaxID=1969726 RepID=UPI0028681376|nr:TolC family outer membrane protein [Sulfurovum sp.]